MNQGWRRSERGVGLIEVLIAILVISVGVLSVVVLQSRSLKNNQSSLDRTQAVVLSYAMLDILRINREAALDGNYDMTKTCTVPTGSGLVVSDKAFWISSLKAGLGNQNTTCGEIDCDSAGVCVVKVYWNDERGTGGSNAQVIETSTQI